MSLVAIGIGSNLPAAGKGGPLQVAREAVAALDTETIRVVHRSSWYWSDPVPPALQSLYVNGIVLAETVLDPETLLRRLFHIEHQFARLRTAANQARTLDLDLLIYDALVIDTVDRRLIVPHPRLHRRAFVLQPLHEVWPEWRHPVSRLSASQLLQQLAGDQWLCRIGC